MLTSRTAALVAQREGHLLHRQSILEYLVRWCVWVVSVSQVHHATVPEYH